MKFIGNLLRFRSRAAERPISGRSLRISPLVKVSAHDDGLALLNVRSGQVFLCNCTGSRIWQALSEGHKPEEVADRIREVYGLEPEVAERHTFSYIRELERRGLVSA